MQSFAIKNQVVLDILEKFRCTYLEKYDIVNMKTNGVFGKEIKDQADYYTGSEFMKSIINSPSFFRFFDIAFIVFCSS